MNLTTKKIDSTIAKAHREGVETVLRESRGRGRGALMLRINPSASAAHWYFRYSVLGKDRRQPVGVYGSAAGEFTIA